MKTARDTRLHILNIPNFHPLFVTTLPAIPTFAGVDPIGQNFLPGGRFRHLTSLILRTGSCMTRLASRAQCTTVVSPDYSWRRRVSTARVVSLWSRSEASTRGDAETDSPGSAPRTVCTAAENRVATRLPRITCLQRKLPEVSAACSRDARWPMLGWSMRWASGC